MSNRLCLLQSRRTMAVVIPPTLASALRRERRARRPSTGSTPRAAWPRAMQNSDLAMVDAESHIRALRARTWRFSGFEVPVSISLGLTSQIGLSLLIRGAERGRMCLFRGRGNTFRELVDRSKQLNCMKIVALAFAAYHSGIAAVSLEPAGRTAQGKFHSAEMISR